MLILVNSFVLVYEIPRREKGNSCVQAEEGEHGVKIFVEEEKGGRQVNETISADKKPLRYSIAVRASCSVFAVIAHTVAYLS